MNLINASQIISTGIAKMKIYHTVSYILAGIMMLSIIIAGQFLWQYSHPANFTCLANFVQHSEDETLTLWLTYHFGEESGLLSMVGFTEGTSSKRINRKISFSIKKKDGFYNLHSEQNVVFPDDSADNKWLEKYEPDFFVYSDKDISVRILEQKNNSYLFVFSNLPTYICHRKD